MEHASRTRLTTAVVLAVVFGAGAVLGLAVDSSVGAEVAEIVSGEENEGGRPERRGRDHTYAQVSPTAEQQLLIDSIIREHRSRTNTLDRENRVAFRRGFREIVLETREAIKVVFTPEQAEEYQRLLDERDAREAADRNGRTGRDGRK